MSVTFFAVQKVGENWKPLWVCTGRHCTGFCADCLKHELNLANTNARALLEWLGLDEYCDDGDLFGDAPATEVVARCNRRLWDEPRNYDQAVPTVESGGPGTGQCLAIEHGRDAGYLRDRTRDLLFIAQCAGEHRVSWA